LILMFAAIVALRPAVRRRAIVLLVPALLTTTIACWGFQGFVQDGLRLYERLLRRRGPEEAS
jgi:hypothetical protein